MKGDPVLSACWRDIYFYDKNKLIIVCGGTGECKSGSSMTLGDIFDVDVHFNSRWTLEKLVWDAQGFIKLINSNHPKGTVIIWDEIGVEHDSREYYTLKNKLIKKVMQTFRYKNFLVLMTVPDLASLDIGTRRLLHGYLEMRGQMPDKKMAKGKFEWIQTNPKSGKTYYKRPRYWENGKYYMLDSYYVPRPRPELEIPYKKQKKIVTKEWYNNFGKQLDFMEKYIVDEDEKKKPGRPDLLALIEIVKENPMECITKADGRNKFSPALIDQYLLKKKIKVNQNELSRLNQSMNIKLQQGEIVCK